MLRQLRVKLAVCSQSIFILVLLTSYQSTQLCSISPDLTTNVLRSDCYECRFLFEVTSKWYRSHDEKHSTSVYCLIINSPMNVACAVWGMSEVLWVAPTR